MEKINELQPGYSQLMASGEMAARVDALDALQTQCRLCPRACGSARTAGVLGACASGPLPEVASWCDHHGEEPPISGVRGSGTIFFAHCNLRCLFCQNHQISQGALAQAGSPISVARLATILLELQERGCHNINFVSPTHYAAQMARGISLAAAAGLRLPIVYNTNGYDSLDTLQLLAGMVDLYLPDLKYGDARTGWELSGVKDYPAQARAALAEMWRQVGPLRLDPAGCANKGMIIRHLILPNDLADSESCLRWIRDAIGTEVTLSLMAQYYPAHHASTHPLLTRPITAREYGRVVELALKLGFENLLVQDERQAPETYRPDFGQVHPFHH